MQRPAAGRVRWPALNFNHQGVDSRGPQNHQGQSCPAAVYIDYMPPNEALDEGPHLKAVPCARTDTNQSAVKLAVSVVPDTYCVEVPAPSLPVIVTRYVGAVARISRRPSCGRDGLKVAPVGSGY